MKSQEKGKLFGQYWPSAAQPAAATACTLLILIVIFLVLVLTPHQCGPEDGAVLVEGDLSVVVRSTTCTSGQGRDAGSVCVDCEPGTYNNGSFTFCQKCPIGFFANETGLSGCDQCAQGTGLTTPSEGWSDSDCVCDRDFSPYGVPGGICLTAPDTAMCLCRESDAGRQTTLDKYCNDGSTNAGCSDCRLAGPTDVWDARYVGGDASGNTRWRDRGCITCPLGKYKDVPSWEVCLECSDPAIPSRMDVNGACLCSPGHFKALDGGCPQCPIGTYKRLASDEGSISCAQCPPGTTTASAAAINLDDCVCAQGFEGFYVDRGDGSAQLELRCRTCQTGYYKDTLGPSDCQPCAPGTHAPTNGTEQCRVCSPGEIASATGSQFCELCLPGKYAPEPGGTECLPCIEDTFNLDYGASRCMQCLPNTFAAEGSARCSDCWQNYLGRSGVYLSKQGDNKLGYSVIPTMFLMIIILAFVFCLLAGYEAYRYLTGKKAPDGYYAGANGFRDIGVADIVPNGGPQMQPMVVPHQQPHPLHTLMQMSREQLYEVQKTEQEELAKDQDRIAGNLGSMQQEAAAQLAQQPGTTQEQKDEKALEHHTQARQLEAFQALQMRSLQERHLKEQEHQMRVQQEQLDQQYRVQQNEWESYQQQQYVEQAQQWDEFQRQMQMNQQQIAEIQPQNYQQPPQYYDQQQPEQQAYPPAPSMPRQGSMVASYPPTSPQMQAMSSHFGPSGSASQAAGSMPAMTPQFAPLLPLGAPTPFPKMPSPQPGYAPPPNFSGPQTQLDNLYGSQPAVFPTTQVTQNMYGSQIAPTTNPYSATQPGVAPGPSAFSQVGSQQPQQANWQPPQDGPTDDEWKEILRQVDGM